MTEFYRDLHNYNLLSKGQSLEASDARKQLAKLRRQRKKLQSHLDKADNEYRKLINKSISKDDQRVLRVASKLDEITTDLQINMAEIERYLEIIGDN